jgi:hypothetical protein
LNDPASAEPRNADGPDRTRLTVAADTSGEKRTGKRQTRSIFSLGPNVPADPPDDEVASRQGKSPDTGGGGVGMSGTGADGRGSGAAPATRSLRGR